MFSHTYLDSDIINFKLWNTWLFIDPSFFKVMHVLVKLVSCKLLNQENNCIYDKHHDQPNKTYFAFAFLSPPSLFCTTVETPYNKVLRSGKFVCYMWCVITLPV